MKKLFFLLCLIISSSLFAQEITSLEDFNGCYEEHDEGKINPFTIKSGLCDFYNKDGKKLSGSAVTLWAGGFGVEATFCAISEQIVDTSKPNQVSTIYKGELYNVSGQRLASNFQGKYMLRKLADGSVYFAFSESYDGGWSVMWGEYKVKKVDCSE